MFECGELADKGKEKKSVKSRTMEKKKMANSKPYPSDLTEAEWKILEPLIPPIAEDATDVLYERREIVNGILYVLRSGCPWRLLPNDLPAWGTVYSYLRTWRMAGIWDKALEALRKQMRQKQGRDEEPSAAVVDSQSIKTSAVRGEGKGFDMGKLIWGRKRNLLVDTQGNLMEVKVTAASDSDLSAGKKLFEPLHGRFPRLQLIWGDSHYGGKFLEWVKEQFGWDVQPVQRLGTAHDANAMEPKPKTKTSKRGFVLEPRRWVVERTFSWITRWRRWLATMRACPKPRRLSSRSRLPVACFPIWLSPSREYSGSNTFLESV